MGGLSFAARAACWGVGCLPFGQLFPRLSLRFSLSWCAFPLLRVWFLTELGNLVASATR